MATGGPSSTRIYTRTGDTGTTGLAGGARIAKDSLRIRAYGTLDELGAQLGIVRSLAPPGSDHRRSILDRVRHQLFLAQSELAVPPKGKLPEHVIEQRHVEEIEKAIDANSSVLESLHTFVLPGGSPLAAQLHLVRTVCRRAERELWTLNSTEPLRPELLKWINRLSDLLFVLSLAANRDSGVSETPPDYTI